MASKSGGSESRDLEAASDPPCSPFDLTSTKNASVDRLKRWRVTPTLLLFYILLQILYIRSTIRSSSSASAASISRA